MESGERKLNKNTKFRCSKLGYFKNRQEYTKNIPKFANNSKKVGPISVGCIGHKIEKLALNLEWSH